MSLAKKVSQLKADSVAGVRVALQWEKMIHEHGEDNATAFYTSLGLNHLEKKSVEWEGLTLSREPTEAEKLCIKSIAQAQESGKVSISVILLSLRNNLIDDSIGKIKKLPPSKYHMLVVSAPESSRTNLRDELISIFRYGRALIARELSKAAQEEEFDELDMLTDVSNARVANDVQARVIAAAARFRLLGLEGDALIAAIASEIQAGSVSYIDRASQGLANKVINLGRSDEAKRHDFVSVEYSAILDQNVCGPCAQDDGQTATNEDDLTPVPNPDCEGGDWCRCFHVFISDTVA